MSNQGKMDCGRRRLVVATAAVGGAGAVAALVPFVSSLLPSERAKAAGAPVEVDISKLEAGQMMTVEWRKPVWIINRTKEMMDTLPKLARLLIQVRNQQPPMPRTIRDRKSWWSSVSVHILVARPPRSSRGGEEGCDGWLGGFLSMSRFDLRFAGPFQVEASPDQPQCCHVYLADPYHDR
jgi:ubiquinol-cytochrome c reductase iron-sulfur subunit